MISLAYAVLTTAADATILGVELGKYKSLGA